MDSKPVRSEAALAEAMVAQCRQWTQSAASRAGGTCSDDALAALSGQVQALMLALQAGHVCLPVAAALAGPLLATGIVRRGDQADGGEPLVFEAGLLYLARQHHAEQALAARVQALSAAGRLCVISGGPGTGKTTTVARLLGRLLARRPEMRVELAAPTGKAAARMMEALQARAGALPEAVQARLPQTASTLHRLLGIRPQQAHPRHGPENPLDLDVLIVDEASMLDQGLALQTVAALPEHAVLILLGDKDQLAAVEAGAVFAELSAYRSACADRTEAVDAWLDALPGLSGTPEPAGQAGLPALRTLADSVIWLQTSHRFAAASPLGRLAASVRDGRAGDFVAALHTADEAVRQMQDDAGEGERRRVLVDGYADYWAALAGWLPGQPVAPLFRAFESYRVLAAVHAGPGGVRALNRLLLEELARRSALPAGPLGWHAGAPVLVLANDPASRLFNGDVGIALPGMRGWEVWFADRREGYRAVPIHVLPAHDSAFAMTVHKSQGSEFDRVAVVFPAQDVPVLTRELLYTGITRARHGVQLLASEAMLLTALGRPTRRDSGLGARLR